jgi:hypothetical protein
MDLTEGSETSEKLNLTPEKYQKENIQDSETRRKFEIHNMFHVTQNQVTPYTAALPDVLSYVL